MKKILSAIVFACLFPLIGSAQILQSANPEADSIAFAKVRARMDSIRQYRPTVGLVLAGGGARGLAHLGVIKYMEELGIPVDIVTGTSMGGLVAGLYALGYKHDQLDSLVRAIEWPIMMSDNIPNAYTGYKFRKQRDKYLINIPFHYDNKDLADRIEKEQTAQKIAAEQGHNSSDMLSETVARMGIGMPDGYLYGLNVRNTLSSVSVGYQDDISFSDLPIPYACVATDLYSLTPKYWTGGSITDALRSTMAIPFYFRAVRRDGEVLLDGGMRNNFPVDIAKVMGADIIIGSEMSVHRELNELNSPADFLMQTITLLSSSTMDATKEMVNLDVHHELKGYNMLSFDSKSVDDIINQGYNNALENKEMFETIASAVAGKADPKVSHPKPAVNLAQKKVKISDIRFTGITEDERVNILQKSLYRSDYPSDSLYDRSSVERLLNSLYGTSAFESVSYHLEGREEPYILVFDCQKGQVHEFSTGVRADTDEAVAAIVHLGLGTRRLSGMRYNFDLKLGTNPSLYLDGLYKFSSWIPTFGASLRARLVNTTSGFWSSIEDKLFSTAVDVFMEDSRLRFGTFRLGLTAEMDPYERYLSYGEEWLGWDWKSYWLSSFATLKHDTFNDGYFPTKGLAWSFNGRYVFKGYSIDLDPAENFSEDDEKTEDGTVPSYASLLGSFRAAISPFEWFTILPSAYLGWYSSWERDYLNPKHIISVGGFIPDRYVERQIPWFGFPTGYRYCTPLTLAGQLDLRFNVLRKNFLTVRGGIMVDNYQFKDLPYTFSYWAFGAEYGRQSIVGPLKIAFQWCNISGFTGYASIGFDF